MAERNLLIYGSIILVIGIFLFIAGFSGNPNSHNIDEVAAGMTIADVDSILGTPDYINEAMLQDTTAVFKYNYKNPMAASGDAYVAFNKDSLVVFSSWGCD